MVAAVSTAVLTGAIGCTSITFPELEQSPVERAPAMYVPYESIYVEVPQGKTCVVYYGGVKVATCYQSGNVMVPKTYSATRADNGCSIVETEEEPEPGIISENTLEMVVAFEDSRDHTTELSDHDYNDLVFQARLSIVNKTNGTNTTTVEITPIAYGASKTIALGVVLTSTGNVYGDKFLYEDCREEMFGGADDFINTGSKHIKYPPLKSVLSTNTKGSVIGVSWYIIVCGERLYASNTFQNCLDNENMPQGLVLMNLCDDVYSFEREGHQYKCGNCFWQYPLESTDIKGVYPGFEEAFLTKGDFSVLANPREDSHFYNAIRADENMVVNDEDCLYTLYIPS